MLIDGPLNKFLDSRGDEGGEHLSNGGDMDRLGENREEGKAEFEDDLSW